VSETAARHVIREPSFREVAEALSLGVPFRVRRSADGGVQFLSVGAGCQALIGVTAEALLADVGAFMSNLYPEDKARMLAEETAALQEQRPCVSDLRFRKPGGDLRWCRLTSSTQVEADGSVVWDGLMMDITEPKRLSEQLAEERRRLEQAVEVTGIGVFQWNREDPEAVLWSDRHYEIFGVPPHTPMTVGSHLADPPGRPGPLRADHARGHGRPRRR